MEILRNEPMSRHTSFRIGGPVAELWLPQAKDELADAITTLRARDIEPLIIGNGSNLLFPDEPTDTIAIKTVPAISSLRQYDETVVYAAAGVTLARLATYAADHAMSGLEFAHGIPASVGGAIFMNAGAYGGEVGNLVRSVDVLTADGELATMKREDCDFSYRHSAFHDNGAVVLSAVFDLSLGDETEIRERMRTLSEQRREKQPLDLPSAGSAFKRPPPKNGESQYAAAMIDACGLKGYCVGGAAVSEKHAGFVVNLGGATCNDVLRLLEHMQTVVFRECGVELETEIRVVRG